MVRFAFALIALAGVGLTACNAKQMDAGPTSSRTVPVGAFVKIASAGSYDVKVRTGAAPSVVIHGPQNIIDRIEVEVHGDELQIGTKHDKPWGQLSYSHHGPVTVEVTTQSIDGASLAGSGNLTVDKASGESFAGNVAGSGNLSVAQITAKQVQISVAGSGDASVSGKADNASYRIAGSGNVRAGGLDVADVQIKIAGSGDVDARATGNADISILGSGDATVSGGAKCSTHKMGSGDAHCS